MLNDWELWAWANQVVKTHGENAPLHVAERVAELMGKDGPTRLQ